MLWQWLTFLFEMSNSSITLQSTYLPCWSCMWTCCGPCMSPCSFWPGKRCLPSRLWSAAASLGLTWWSEGSRERWPNRKTKKIPCEGTAYGRSCWKRQKIVCIPAACLSTVFWRGTGLCSRSAVGRLERLPCPACSPPPLGEVSWELPVGDQSSARNIFFGCCEAIGAKSDTCERKQINAVVHSFVFALFFLKF